MSLMYSVTLVALAVSIRHYHRHKNLRVFTYYILFSLLEDAAGANWILGGPNKVIPEAIHGVIGNIFMLMEFSVFVHFILQYVPTVKRRRAIQINAVIFFLFVMWVMIRDHRFVVHAALFAFESFFLVLPALLYFFEVFVNIKSNPLKDQPAFWIVTGILFLNCCSIPLQFAISFVGRYWAYCYNLNYLLYILFFLLLIKAYLCKPALQWKPAIG